MQSVRSILGDLQDAQSDGERGHIISAVVARAAEDVPSISEFIHCGHVDQHAADQLAEAMAAAGWTGGRLKCAG